MAIVKKTLFPKNLDRYAVLVPDTEPNSRYFKITELPDTFTGGKNAFLIAGSEDLVADTKIQIELKDSAGNVIYHEPGEGIISSSINGESFVAEYYEGVSKVVSVYVYPDTAYGPCTLTILGELNQYVDGNGILTPVPLDWENKYNVKWQKTINVNPSLSNTTKIRFYRRPQATIKEILSPIYRIESGSKVNSGVSQSFAEIKLSQLETFAGDVKRVKVFRTSLGDISDYDLIQDILVESKELLTTFGLSGSVIGNTGIFTSETLKNYWNTGSLKSELTSSRIESGVKLSGSGHFAYTQSLDIRSGNTYELNLDAFYSSSTSSNLGIYLSYVSQSTTFTSSVATLIGTQPTKNLLDTIIPFRVDRDYPSASLYFSQSRGEWHLGNIGLGLSQDTAFSPDEISFITTMPTVIGDETYNFKFEFYDVNNNYVPVSVTQSANFTGGNIGKILRSLTLESDRTAFRFSTGSYGNPPFQQLGLSISKTNLTGSVTYGRSVFDTSGNYIAPASYAGTYPGTLTNSSDAGATLTIANFSGSLSSVIVGSIVYTASCDGLNEYETIYRFEDGDNAPGVFVTANTNQFIYKATDLSLNPSGQIITIEAKRKNLASSTTTLTINSGSGKPPLTLVSTNATNGVDTYTISGTSYPYSTGETIYSISGSDQFGNIFSDAIKISPVKILDGLSVSLTNDNASLPARSTGFVESGSFVLSSGSVSVKVGNEIIAHSNGLSANNRFDVVSAVASNVQTGSLTYSTTDYFITRLDADSGSLNLTIRYKDGAGDTSDTTKLVTYTKNKKAAPVLQISSTPKDQTVTAKSTGEQIDAFSNVTISVKQTYDGATTNLTITSLTATSSDIASISTTPSTGLVTLTGKTLANGVNSTTVNISAVVTDSEGVSRTITDTLALSKTKKAAPNIVVSATPQAQSILATAAGVQTGNLTNVTVSALEGTTSRFTSMTATYTGFSTNPTITTNTLTTAAAIMNAAEASATIVVTHTDSEGTTGQTQTIVVRFTKVPTGTAGTNGLNGADGGSGPGVVYRGDWSGSTAYYSSSIRVDVVKGSDSEYYLAKVGHTSTAAGTLDKPITGTSYATYWRPFGATFESIATDILLARDATITRGLVMGTYGATDKGFIRSANASALMTGKGYYLDTTGSMRFGDPAGGYIRFTETDGVRIAGNVAIEGTVTIGGTDATSVKDGAAAGALALQPSEAANDVNTNNTNISGAKIRTGNIESNNWDGPDAGEEYADAGMRIDLTNGSMTAKNFLITSAGAAKFRGAINGGTISIGTKFNVDSQGNVSATNAALTGSIVATSGQIGDWIIDAGKLTNSTGTISIDATGRSIIIYSGSIPKVSISGQTELTNPYANQIYSGPHPTIGNVNTSFSETTTISTNIDVNKASTGWFGNIPINSGPQTISYYGSNIDMSSNSMPKGHAAFVTALNEGRPGIPGYVSITTYIDFRNKSSNNIYSGQIQGGFYQGPYEEWDEVDPEHPYQIAATYANSSTGLRNFIVTFNETGNYEWRIRIDFEYRAAGDMQSDNSIQYLSTTCNASLANANDYINVEATTNLIELTNRGFQVLNNQDNFVQIKRYDTSGVWNDQPLINVQGGQGIRSYGVDPGGGNSYGKCLDLKGRIDLSDVNGGGFYGMFPSNDIQFSNGTSAKRWTSIYAQNGTIQTSDRNQKKNIENSELGLDFINDLKPVKYKFIKNTSDRTHYGLIAQDVTSSLDKFNVDKKDFAGFISYNNYVSGSNEMTEVAFSKIENEDDKIGWNKVEKYSLRYDEFISPMIKAMQELSAKVQELEARLSGSI